MIPDFNLPARTVVNKAVPKNAFETRASAKQKKQLTAVVEKITWLNKLSIETINLDGNSVQEIQVFHVALKKREMIPDLLQLMDKAIPYPILFIVNFNENFYLSLASKHANPADANTSVIDWVFTTDWLVTDANNYGFALRRSLDYVLLDLCAQLSSTDRHFDDLEALIAFEKEKAELESKISKLTYELKRTAYFKGKVALNLELQALKKQLKKFLPE